MKPEELSPKAREAFGKSLVDIGVAIFKSLMLLITVVPLAALLKASLNTDSSPVSIFKLLSSISMGTYFVVIALMCLGFWIGLVFRREGIRHIHEVELAQDKKDRVHCD